MRKRSKRYRRAFDKLERGKLYELSEAVALIKSFDSPKFDETVEIALKLGVDPRKGDQVVRGSVSLPKGIGKEVRVAVFAEGEKADAAREAGADVVGSEDLAKKVSDGFLDFDVAIAAPDMMKHVGKLGRVLGPQGKMPSPKAGTVTDDVATAVREFKAGKIEFRVDAGANLHAPMGRKSFTAEDLAENVQAFLDHVKALRPSSAKGVFMQRATISASMSPGVPLAISAK
ncbi:MAG: 50S ribosomal protein L1 [Planctomycetota bacterium]